MRSWFGSSSTVLTLIIKTTNGELEDKIQIQSDESVKSLKTLIDEKFECDPDLQKLVFHGQILQTDKLLSDYKIVDNSVILLMNTNQQQPKPQPKPKPRNPFDKSNPYYQSQSNISEPGKPSNNTENTDNDAPQGPYFDPILNQLAKYHPELPMAVMEHSKEVGDLMQDLNKRYEIKTDGDTGTPGQLSQEEQSLAAYYYYLSLASLSAVTTTVASSVYQHLPSKEQLANATSATVQTMQSIIRPDSENGSNDIPNNPNNEKNENTNNNNNISRHSMSWMKHLQKLVSNTKLGKAAIDRLVSLGFDKTESVEAYLACDKDEALAAVFMSQERKINKPTKGGPMDNDNNFIDDEQEEEKKEDKSKSSSIDASMGYINEKHELKKTPTKTKDGYPVDEQYDKTIINNSIYFKQFQKWIRNVFEDDELYYRYLLLFMKEKIADMTCLEDINYDEEYLENIGIKHRIHRKRMIKAIGLFVTNKNKFEIWWNETIQFKKYLKLFQKNNVWDLEELLLQIRSPKDIENKIGIDNGDDVENIWKHVENLRKQHTLYNNIKSTGSILTPNMMPTVTAYNPNATQSIPHAMPHPINPNPNGMGYTNNNVPSHMNYSAPPMYPDIAAQSDNNGNIGNIGNNNMAANASNISIQSNNSQQEGAITQM